MTIDSNVYVLSAAKTHQYSPLRFAAGNANEPFILIEILSK